MVKSNLSDVLQKDERRCWVKNSKIVLNPAMLHSLETIGSTKKLEIELEIWVFSWFFEEENVDKI